MTFAGESELQGWFNRQLRNLGLNVVNSEAKTGYGEPDTKASIKGLLIYIEYKFGNNKINMAQALKLAQYSLYSFPCFVVNDKNYVEQLQKIRRLI